MLKFVLTIFIFRCLKFLECSSIQVNLTKPSDHNPNCSFNFGLQINFVQYLHDSKSLFEMEFFSTNSLSVGWKHCTIQRAGGNIFSDRIRRGFDLSVNNNISSNNGSSARQVIQMLHGYIPFVIKQNRSGHSSWAPLSSLLFVELDLIEDASHRTTVALQLSISCLNQIEIVHANFLWNINQYSKTKTRIFYNRPEKMHPEVSKSLCWNAGSKEQVIKHRDGQWVCPEAVHCNTSVGWKWEPVHCKIPILSLDAFKSSVQRYNLRQFLFIGTSRMRTMYYDLLLWLGLPLAYITPTKDHKDRTDVIADLNITFHLHWLDVSKDINRRNRNLPNGYFYSQQSLRAKLISTGICCPNCTDSENFSLFNNSLSAVIFTTGLWEADMISGHQHYPHVQSLAATAMCRHGLTNPGNIFTIKLEESVDYRHPCSKELVDINEYIITTVWPLLNQQCTPPWPIQPYLNAEGRNRANTTAKLFNNSCIRLLDSYTPTRSFQCSEDWIHYYDDNMPFVGNAASKSMANMIVASFVHELNDRQAAHIKLRSVV